MTTISNSVSIQTILRSSQSAKTIEEKTDTESRDQAGAPTPPVVKHVPLAGSPGLLTLTSISLFCEAATHFIPHNNRPLKILARTSVGSLQMLTGLLGMDYYQSRFQHNADVRSGTMLSGYGLFLLEGLSRVIEARKKNMPITGAIGASAAFFKTSGAIQPLCSNSYAVDAIANLVEMRHGTPEPKNKGFAKALWSLGHSMERRHIAILQISAASAMAANAAQKIIDSMRSSTRKKQPSEAALSAEKEIENKIERLLTRLENTKEMEEFEQLCTIQDPDQCEKELRQIFERS